MYDKTTFLSGLAMGLCGKGNPTFEGSGKMLYNGGELPNIESVLAQYPQYPYALTLNYKATSVYRLNISDNPYGITTNFSGKDAYKSNGTGIAFWLENGVWTYHNTFSGTTWTVDDYSDAWTSHDILNDGNIYLAASDPVPVEDTFTKGYKVGAELRSKRTLPVAYLYNGVRLSKLPKWDKEAYPYAFIHIYNTTGTLVLCGGKTAPSVIATTNLNGSVSDSLSAYTAVPYTQYESTQGGEWSSTGEVVESVPEYGLVGWGAKYIVWTNTDLWHTNGTLYLAASDPVPVYE